VPGAGRTSGEGPFSARTIGVHCSPPSRRGCNRAMLSHPPVTAGMPDRASYEEIDRRAGPARHPLVRALALHGVARQKPRSHLASPLTPGRGVLIRSVSRRVGSVAYVREDASPNKVSVLHSVLRMPARRRVCQAYCAYAEHTDNQYPWLLHRGPAGAGERLTALFVARGLRPESGTCPVSRQPPPRWYEGHVRCCRTGRTLQRGHATSRGLAGPVRRPG
jgi:hypothetical protein